jgi:hypothetical protein
MPTINRLVQQIARITFGCVGCFAGSARAVLRPSAAGNGRFSILGKMSPLVRDAIHAAKMKKGRYALTLIRYDMARKQSG